MPLTQRIQNLCQELLQEFDLIPKDRKEKLHSLGNYVSQKHAAGLTPSLIVICTHNSRRSHLGQLWLAVAAECYGLPEVKTFSGGTEATAFNPRAVAAIREAGFGVVADDVKKENPVYSISWMKKMKPYHAFSKRYADAPNPAKDFAAVMVCSEADAGCPLVFGCDFRLALPYDDPKEFDGTPLESEKYTERLRERGREMLYALSGQK